MGKAGYKSTDKEMGEGRSSGGWREVNSKVEEEGCKISMRVPEKALRNHTTNYLPKNNYNTYNFVYKYTYVVLINFSYLGWQLSLKESKNTHQNPNIRNQKTSSELLSWAVQETPKTQSIAFAHGFP